MQSRLRNLLEALVLTIALNLISSGLYDSIKDWVTSLSVTATAHEVRTLGKIYLAGIK